MKVFFDLDGTLLDSKQRLYQLFQFLVPQSTFTFETYWLLKQDKVSHREILAKYFDYTDDTILKFTAEWMVLIESSEWLNHDKLFNGVKPFLDTLKEKNELYVVTARQFEDKTINQIENLGLNNIFTDVLVTLQKNEKSDLIKKHSTISSSDWIVGDTGKDVLTGKKLGINTAAVLSGFLSKKHLLTYSPDIVVDNVELLKF